MSKVVYIQYILGETLSITFPTNETFRKWEYISKI